MLNQSKYQSLIRGESVALTDSELPEFLCYCAEGDVLPDQFCRIAVQLYRRDHGIARLFVQHVVTEIIPKEKYQCSLNNEAKAKLYYYHSALSLGRAIRGEHGSPSQEDFGSTAMEYVLKGQDVCKNKSFSLNRMLIRLYSADVTECLNFAKKLEGELSSQYNKMKHQLTTVQMVQAQCHFSKRAYEKALDCLRKCFLRNNCLPLKARLAMAYCYFFLNKFQMARACAQRILQIEPRCADAFACLAIVHERMEDYQNYFEYLKLAYQCDQDNALVLYLIAEHFLIRNDLQKAQEICMRGLKALNSFARFIGRKQAVRCDFIELESRFFNIQGQIQHKRKNYVQAIQHYSKAAQHDLLWNDASLVQCLISQRNYKDALERMEYIYKVYEREKKDCRFLKDTYRIMAHLKYKCKANHDPAKDAIYYYNEAIKFDKNDPDLKEELCYLYTIIQLDKHKALRTMQDLEKQLNASNIQLKPETLINIGVLLMENHEPEEGEVKLKKAIETIQKWDDLDLSQQRGFLIIAKYNYAICLEKGNYNYKALDVFEQILKINYFHLNTILKKSLILHKIGDNSRALRTLAQAQANFHQRLTSQGQVDKIKGMRAYLLYLQEKYKQSFQIVAELVAKRQDYIYYQVLEFAVKYNMLSNNQQHENDLQKLLITGKEYFEKVCYKNNKEIFCYMILAVINAIFNTISKDQGNNIFKKILVSKSKIPAIRFNMGLYYMHQQDSEAAISCFNQHRQEAHSTQVDELIAHQYLVCRDFKRCLKTVKKNIMLDPGNYKHRAQLCLATHARCQEELPNENKRIVLQNYHQMKKCTQIYRFLEGSKLTSLTINNQQISKMKQVCSQKNEDAKKLLQKYEKKAKPYEQNESRKENHAKQAGGDESEDEEDKRIREMKEKKEKVLALSKLKSQSVAESWNIMNEKQKAIEEEKLKRKAPKEATDDPSPKPKRKQKPKDKKQDASRTESEDYYSVNSVKKEKVRIKKEAGKEGDEIISKYLVE